MTKTITATVGGQKRILMAVPKEMYMSAVKTGKITPAQPLASSNLKSLPVQVSKLQSILVKPQVQTQNIPPNILKRKLPNDSEAESVKMPIHLPQERGIKVNETHYRIPLQPHKIARPSEIPCVRRAPSPEREPRVYQVAPDLPVQATPVTVSTFDWKTLTPEGWQDWPVPTDVFLASTVQLKNNYLKLFPKRDRMDIETTLHLAANYNNLGNEAKAHVRARVHHFLKILQLEKSKLNITNTENEN